MSDLVERLRDYASTLGGYPDDYLTWKAADRIEMLEAALATCRELREYDQREITKLRAALAPPEQDK